MTVPSTRHWSTCEVHFLESAENMPTSSGCVLFIVLDGKLNTMMSLSYAISLSVSVSWELCPSRLRTMGLSLMRHFLTSGAKVCFNHAANSFWSIQPVGEVAILYLSKQIELTLRICSVTDPPIPSIFQYSELRGPSAKTKDRGIESPAAETHSIIITSSKLSLWIW